MTSSLFPSPRGRQNAGTLLLWWTLSALAGCTSPKPASPKEAPVVQQECTLETPLVPGIPGSPGHWITSSRNPNGDSELAVLMREMLHDLQRIRPDIVAGKAPSHPGPMNHHLMRCSWPNEPSVRGPVFGALATSYLTALKQLKIQNNPSPDAYNGVVAGCLGCHNQFCPGPIHLIQNLWID
jgi:hypothetical protein